MLSEAQIRSVALFYFYVLLDENQALDWTLKSLRQCLKSLGSESESDSRATSLIVHHTHLGWKKIIQNKATLSASIVHEAAFVIPPSLDLGVWKQFRKDADGEEFLAVIWSKILGFSDQEIATGLGVSLGTVRYRVGRGLRHLGSLKQLR